MSNPRYPPNFTPDVNGVLLGISRELDGLAPPDGPLVSMSDLQEAFDELWGERSELRIHGRLLMLSLAGTVSSVSRQEVGVDEDGYYDSSNEYWPDSHKYEASDTDEVLKLIDDTLGAK